MSTGASGNVAELKVIVGALSTIVDSSILEASELLHEQSTPGASTLDVVEDPQVVLISDITA